MAVENLDFLDFGFSAELLKEDDDDEQSYSPIERFKNRVEDDNAFTRRLAAKELFEVLSLIENSTQFGDVILYISKLGSDPEAYVRVDIIEEFPKILDVCSNVIKVDTSSVLDQHVLPCLLACLRDSNSQVRKACQEVLILLLKNGIITQDHVENKIWHVVLSMCKYMDSDEQRGESVAILSRMAPIIGSRMTEELILPHFIELCSDSLFSVRKICATYFGEVCSVVGTEVTEAVLLCKFYSLCTDNVWGVRKACAECATQVSRFCLATSRWNDLTCVFYNLLTDQSRWVRAAAYQQLGPFIATFADFNKSGFKLNDEGELVKVTLPSVSPVKNDSNPQAAIEPVPTNSETQTEPSKPPLSDEVFQGDQPNSSQVPGRRSRTVSNSYDVSSEGEDTIHIRVDNNSAKPTASFTANNFWRVPIPELDVSLDMKDGKPTSIRVTSRVVDSITDCVYTSALDVDLEEGENGRLTAKQSQSLGDNSDDNDDNAWWNPFADCGATSSSSLYARKRLSSSVSQDVDVTKQDVIPSNLLSAYIRMADPDKAQSVDSETAKYCAYSIPAVLFTLGPKHWCCLKMLYETLAQDLQWKVRRTLAFSLHQLVQLLGPELTKSELVPILTEFVKDVDEVKLGVLSHLADLCNHLPPSLLTVVVSLLPELAEVENERNWRYRKRLAAQLSELTTVLSPADTEKHIVPHMWRLLVDSVAKVRKTAIKLACSIIYKYWKSNFGAFGSLLRSILLRLGDSKSWYRRQTMVHLCCHLVRTMSIPHTMFAEVFLVRFLELASDDPVPNVRLVAAQGLLNVMYEISYYTSEENPHREALIEVEKKLMCDKDRDVRRVLNKGEDSPAQFPLKNSPTDFSSEFSRCFISE